MILKNKNIFITGGSSGLGLATAKILSEMKANVYVCSSNKNHLDEAIKNTNIKGIVCDITNSAEIENIKTQLSDIDILINNAGIWLEGNIEENSYENISLMIDVNVKGTLYITKALLPFMKSKNNGIILNVSSTSGVKAKPMQSAYIASKFAIQGFTEGLKEDMINTGINIIGFYPGGMQTELFSKAGNNKDTSKFMSPVDIAKAIVFILENADKINIDHMVITRPKIH